MSIDTPPYLGQITRIHVSCDMVRDLTAHALRRAMSSKPERGWSLYSGMGHFLDNPSCSCGNCDRLLSEALVKGGGSKPTTFLMCTEAETLQEEMEKYEDAEDSAMVALIDTRLHEAFILHKCGSTWRRCIYWPSDPGDGWEVVEPADLVVQGADKVRAGTAQGVTFYTYSGSKYVIRPIAGSNSLSVARFNKDGVSVIHTPVVNRIYGDSILVGDLRTSRVVSARTY